METTGALIRSIQEEEEEVVDASEEAVAVGVEEVEAPIKVIKAIHINLNKVFLISQLKLGTTLKICSTKCQKCRRLLFNKPKSMMVGKTVVLLLTASL